MPRCSGSRQFLRGAPARHPADHAVLLAPPFRVLLVWVHDRTHSLPVVMLMHAAVSFVTLTVRPEGLTGTRLLASLLVSPATMWLLLAAVGLANNWRLSHQPAQASVN